MEDAERVARAMQSGPNLAEFVSDYVAVIESAGSSMPSRKDLVEEIAYAWAERAVQEDDSDVVYQDVATNVQSDIEYYL